MNHDEAILDRLFRAIETGDVPSARACFTPDARIWHNYDCIAHDLDGFVASLEQIAASGLKMRYDDIRREPTPSGFVQHHLLVMPKAEGGWTGKPCCMVAIMRDGLIAEAREYLDRGPGFAVDALPGKTVGI